MAIPVSVRLRLRLECRMALRRLAQSGDRSDALPNLHADALRMHNCAQSIGRGARLPAQGGIPRVLALARQIVSGGSADQNLAEIERMTAEFDDAHNLTMAELERLPDALRIALCEAFADAARDAAHFLRMRRRAARGSICARVPRDDVFCEHALTCAMERGDADAQAHIIRIIERRGGKPEWTIERAHAIAADIALRMGNITAMLRRIDAARWDDVFSRLSRADAELHEDPSGVYPAMDARSQAFIRRQLAYLACKTKQREDLIARRAVLAAQAARAQCGADDAQATVCYYFADDDGRRELLRALNAKARIGKIAPDARGNAAICAIALSTIAVLALAALVMEYAYLAFAAVPAAFCAAMMLLARIYPKFIRPRPILKLDLDRVGADARTLVVLPVLISDVKRAAQMLRRMETLGCMEADPDVEFLLLGDFRDAECAHMPEDDEILSALRRGIDRLNRGTEKYHLLMRGRSYREIDGRWMGKNRKRGALMELNRLLLDTAGAAEAFSAESAAAARIAGRFSYVITLDADTEYIPGTVQRLAGAMHHPMNRPRMENGVQKGYAVLQPCMQTDADTVRSAYARLMAGWGGMDGYPFSTSDFWQDVSGRGSFAGKGIYAVRPFARATDGVLNDDAILSHDMIEGMLCGGGMLSDVAFYEGAPKNLSSDLGRTHRWIRGDWQLLPVIASKIAIAPRDRMRLIGNLLRSAREISIFLVLLLSMWLDAPNAFAVGMAFAYFEAILHPIRDRGAAWKKCTLDLAVLPARAWSAADAIARTLYRLLVSHKHLMDWVPAADIQKGRRDHLAGRIAALLVLPALLRTFWLPAAIGLALLFLIGVGWANDLSDAPAEREDTLSARQIGALCALSRETWAFFEAAVPLDGCGLPPDNVQIDPPVGAAMRTSPTNIGLYMTSCVAARKMGFIRTDEMLRRLRASTETLEKLEKWHGQLYNWYDLKRLAPMHPRYVSAVDSGNLAACLLLCANAVRDAFLAQRMRDLCADMELERLYDADRKLFFIGADAENGRVSASHYDLFASESRILSYTAIMLGKAPVRHWQALSRPTASIGGECAALSWSGTMFEYLMPDLFLNAPAHSLSGQSSRTAIRAQLRFARKNHRPMGISESGCHTFDLHMNYQYRAFGLRDLSLSGECAQYVVAPYASALALRRMPAAAANNIIEMRDLGWFDGGGMMEAADYLNADAQGVPAIVYSHMAHHQGMILCALCNALCDGAIWKTFMDIPQARALRLMLCERETKRARRRGKISGAPLPRGEQNLARVPTENNPVDTHILHGGGVTAIVCASGAVFARCGDLLLNRFFGDLRDARGGMHVHIRDENADYVFGAEDQITFDAGCARFEKRMPGIDARLEIAVSPEDGTILQRVTLENKSQENRRVSVTGCFDAALCDERDYAAHPTFANLFVHTEAPDDHTILFSRRARDGQTHLQMAYIADPVGAGSYETDLEALVGRTGACARAGGIAETLSNTAGYVLNPCAALRRTIALRGGERMQIGFALICDAPEHISTRIAHAKSRGGFDRAAGLANGILRAALRSTALDARAYRLIDRAAARMIDPALSAERADCRAAEAAPRALLWKAGISGDLPLIVVRAEDAQKLDGLKQAAHMHMFYGMMGLKCDLIVLCGGESGYYHPLRDAVRGVIDLCGCGTILSAADVEPDSRAAILRAAAIVIDAAQPLNRQLRAALNQLAITRNDLPEYAPMRAGALPKQTLEFANGFGGFVQDSYRIDRLPPAAWSNIIANDAFGALITDRGGGFIWHGNSRSGRITAFSNDPLREGWGWMLYLVNAKKRRWMRLLPGSIPMTDFAALHRCGESEFRGTADGCAFSVRIAMHDAGVYLDVRAAVREECAIVCAVDWLMGTDRCDAAMVRTWSDRGMCFASGASGAIGYMACGDPEAVGGCSLHDFTAGGDLMQPRGFDALNRRRGGWILKIPIRENKNECGILIGSAPDVRSAYAVARAFRMRPEAPEQNDWCRRIGNLQIETPNAALNRMMNGCLQAQTMFGRILGRTGLYQPGGAYGFRDQLQDMLPVIYYDPERVRAHLLRCAARQFESGDVLHWWHEPYQGVRTDIRDDLLFLPYVAAQYVRATGDASALDVCVPYLQDVPIPDGCSDLYGEMQPSAVCESLHQHIMRAFRRADRTGEHGLALMGGGDWNDGMNRIGAKGRGESVWLSEFMAVCASEYASVAPNGEDRAYLTALSDRMRAAVETCGWDGKWYLRAYDDEGSHLGGADNACCRIDVISQAWAVLAGLDAGRCASAMDAVWEQLVDEKTSAVRLLTPPFDGESDPGYIAAYPPGIRENGAQYTHAACWAALAYARMGDSKRAHAIIDMLLPIRHSDSPERAAIYKTEPYALAADVYFDDLHIGRGGWTWYTGAAAWLQMAIFELLGFEMRDDRVRIHALLGDWESCALTLRYKSAQYRLICTRTARQITLDGEMVAGDSIRLTDDGKTHTALFPARKATPPPRAAAEMPDAKTALAQEGNSQYSSNKMAVD